MPKHPQRKTVAIVPDWWNKTLAGLLLGFTLALGCGGVFVHLTNSLAPSSQGQLAMWLVAPIWLGVLSGVYFFTNGKRAWGCLLLANLVVFGVFLLLKRFYV